MHTIHPLNDFLFEPFPKAKEAGNNIDLLKQEIETVMKDDECAVQHKPDDYISLTQIAINQIQKGSPDAARQYLDSAFALNPAYPNIYYAFALLADAEHHSREAFEMSVVALFKNPKKDLLYQQSLRSAMKAASEIIDEEIGGDIVNAYASMLEEECGKKIVIEADAGLKTAAKIEFAENHDRSYHLLKYNPDYPTVHHLIMHELAHLHFATQARQAGKNKLFVSYNENKKRFLASLDEDARKLSKNGYDDALIKEYYTMLFQRLNQQINTPIDLYIEDYLFQNYPALMPYQFLSLLGLIQEGIHATTDEQILTIAPPAILSKSKSFNLVNALHFKKRYGVNLIEEHQPTASEREQAETFYREYEECRTRHTPGDEYELLQRWANQLYLQNAFSLVEEPDYREQSDLIECLSAEVRVDLPGKGDALSEAANPADKKMQLFTGAHQGKDINMAVTRFMVEALHYFKKLSDSEINAIAIQTGLLYGKGITPDAEGYTIPLIAAKTFTGYQVLAYYYVSQAKAFPEYLLQLQLPFDKEYEFALEMVGMGGG